MYVETCQGDILEKHHALQSYVIFSLSYFMILLIIFRMIYYNNMGFKAVMHDTEVSPKTHCSNMFTIWRLLLIISFILKTVLTRSLKTCDLSPDFINSQHGLLVKEFMYM